MWRSIQKGPYVRPVITDPDDTTQQVNEPLSKMTKINKKQYIADVRVMNYLLQAIPNDIYNSMDTYDYQGELHGDAQEDKLTTAMLLLAQDGRVDIQTKNAGYGGNGNRNVGRQNRNQAFNARNVNDESHYARDCQKPRVRDAKYFREQMLLAMKDEAESNLNAKENDYMLDNSFGDETLEELTAAVIIMARIQPTDGNAVTDPTYDAKAISEVNSSHKAHEQVNHVKRKTIIHASNNDQIDFNIIFDDPYVENNGGTSEHDSNDHAEYHNIQILAYNVQKEARNKNRLNNELKSKKSCYKRSLIHLEHEIRADKDTIERILKEKDKIESDFFKIENEKIIIQHETQLAKKDFKERENRYLEDIVDLKEKLSSHDRIVYNIEDMDSESIHMVAASKVPMLKPGKFEIWRMKIEQYIQMIDYALWEVIENGNSTPKIIVVEGVEKVIPSTTVEEKAQKRLENVSFESFFMNYV
ncbi:hypothetical protein Tco_0782078 [Tanacetum coccineum]